VSVSLDLTPPRRELSAAALLDLAQNPEKYRAIQADLDRRTATLQALIAQYGPIEQIQSLRAEAAAGAEGARSALAQARQKLADAQSESERLLADVRAEAERQLEETSRRTEKMTQEASTAASIAEARARQVGERHAKLDIREDAIAQKEQALARERQEVAALRAALGERARRLKDALAQSQA
jgi:hypothetical protein